MSETPNAAQAVYWNDAAGPTWAELHDPLDRQLEPLGLQVMAALAPVPGERILDLGCGAGATSAALAAAVAPDGQVTGIDISRTLLDVARRRGAGTPGLTFIEGDAQTYPFEAGAFDGAFSRFGVMFFAEPAAAFSNVRRALKPGGRLAFVCWRTMSENPIMTAPMDAAARYITPPPPSDPGAPGPFAFADPDRVRRILAEAGFANVEVSPHDQKIGAGDLETAIGLALRVGPLGAVLRENPDQREVATAAIREALAAHDGPDGVKLDSATWIVTARAP